MPSFWERFLACWNGYHFPLFSVSQVDVIDEHDEFGNIELSSATEDDLLDVPVS